MKIYKIVVLDAVAQSVECTTPCEDAIGSIPAVATRSLLVGALSLECDWLRQKSWSPSSISCGST